MANKADPYARIFPLPVGPLYLAQSIVCAEGAVYRAAIVIAIAFWVSGCRTRPTSQGQLATLARLPQSHMDRMQPALSDALDELFPMLEAEWTRHKESAAVRKAMATVASHATPHFRKARGDQSGKSIANTPIQPKRKRKWQGDQVTDLREHAAVGTRETAAAAAHTARGGTGGLLSDASGSGRK